MLEIILKELKDKSVATKWLYAVFFVFAIHGIQDAFFSIYKNIKEFNSPTEMVAYVQSADYQGSSFDQFSVNIRNPTKDDGSINNFAFYCKQYIGEPIYLNVANNHSIFKLQKPSMETMPINIKKGESKTVQIYVAKTKDSLLVNEQCKSIAPIWSDTNLKQQTGKSINLRKGSVYNNFTN
ncbi:hypothetical protein [Alteromonas naphthalenivorans]|uniref:Uncharacterized protein n=1 Tax=Alteromonas naphthalenivorans TaxID=715451 RepID=F5Z862_ALTNA|nr:hypothetical protein [Alteromonas naphthalenivorans]AEF03255.1 hypothetical protein ambt_08635 [Alteromonas naphthalenivorans]